MANKPLIVDDVTSMCRSLMLGSHAARVRIADSAVHGEGFEGSRFSVSDPFDLVLTDFGPPGMSKYSFAPTATAEDEILQATGPPAPQA